MDNEFFIGDKVCFDNKPYKIVSKKLDPDFFNIIGLDRSLKTVHKKYLSLISNKDKKNKRYNISKELFEAITGEDTGNVFEIYYKPRISINEFFFKCKEWARNKGYEPVVFEEVDKTFRCVLMPKYKMDEYEDISSLATTYNWFDFASEQQAVFHACEWIRKELLK